MNAKEALLMLKLGAKIKRSVWDRGSYITLIQNELILARYPDGRTIWYTVESLLTQEWTDWKVYCP